MLYGVMRHRTQLYLDDVQYRWLKQQASQGRSIAEVVRELIDAARSRRPSQARDPLIRYLLEEPAAEAAEGVDDSTVQTLDQDIYG
jgi:hypothetical protein